MDFYRTYVAKPDNSHGGSSPEGKQVMRFRLSADRFFDILKGDEFGDFPSLVEGLLKTFDTRASSRQQWAVLLNERYMAHMARLGLRYDRHQGTFPNLNIRTLDGFPELCAAPDARVVCEKEGIDYMVLVILHDVSQILNGSTLQQAYDVGVPLPVHKSEGQWRISNNEAIWYKAAGLFQAFPENEADSCHYVVYGPNQDNAVPDNMVVIPIDRDDPEIIRISSPETFKKLREFYFGAVLPELAHSRREAGLELRKSLIDKSIGFLCFQRRLEISHNQLWAL